MRGQAGFFDLDERLRDLSAKGDALERLSGTVDYRAVPAGLLPKAVYAALMRVAGDFGVPCGSLRRSSTNPYSHRSHLRGGAPQEIWDGASIRPIRPVRLRSGGERRRDDHRGLRAFEVSALRRLFGVIR
jgi:hypothetical protein